MPKQFGLKLGRSKILSPKSSIYPFQNLKRVGQVEYALNLLKDWKIHNVFRKFVKKIRV
jgi:hypothetical protein